MAEHRVRIVAWTALVTLPLAGLSFLLAAPDADVRWEHHPATSGSCSARPRSTPSLAYATGEAAAPRAATRACSSSRSRFLAAAGFLGLHALATPGSCSTGPTRGFVLATPVGLLLAAVLRRWSAMRARRRPGALACMRSAGCCARPCSRLMALWAVVSLAEVAPLDDPTPTERASAPLIVLARRRGRAVRARRGRATWRSTGAGAAMLLAIVAAFVLLAEAMIAVAFARNWHASWWEWHLLMLAAFALVALARAARGPAERFSDLYLDETAAGKREVSVLFADLPGFTASPRPRPARGVGDAERLLRGRDPAVVDEHGGEIDRFIGDAMMATFNTRGDQPDHAAARGARRARRCSARPPRSPRAIRTGRASGSASTRARRWSASSARAAGAATR